MNALFWDCNGLAIVHDGAREAERQGRERACAMCWAWLGMGCGIGGSGGVGDRTGLGNGRVGGQRSGAWLLRAALDSYARRTRTAGGEGGGSRGRVSRALGVRRGGRGRTAVISTGGQAEEAMSPVASLLSEAV